MRPARARLTLVTIEVFRPPTLWILIIAGPHIDPADWWTESEALLNSTDIFATVAEIVGSAANADDFVSLLPHLEDPDLTTRTERPHVYAELFSPNHSNGYNIHERAIRGESYKLIKRGWVYEEFFKIDTDRWEQDNLLPIENLSTAELRAYNDLVDAMEALKLDHETPVPALARSLAAALALLYVASGAIRLRVASTRSM